VRIWSRSLEIQHAFVADAGIVCLTLTAGMIVAGCQDGTVQFLQARATREGS
jgi:hypothetical protein